MKMGELFKNYYSDFLFARPSFWSGMARIFDLGGTLNIYNVSRSESEADIRALHQDWSAVGESIRAAYNEYKRAHGQKIEKTPSAVNHAIAE
jgi:hypothetical protein